MDDADWSTTLGLQANYNDVTVTCNAYQNSPEQIGRNLFEFQVSLMLVHDFCVNSCIDKVPKIGYAFYVPIDIC